MSMTAVDPYALAQLLLRKGLVSQSNLLRSLQYYLHRRLAAGELAYRISRERPQAQLVDASGQEQGVIDWPSLPPPPRGWVPYSPDVLALLDGETGQFQRVVPRTEVQGPSLGEAGGMCAVAGRLYALTSWLDERLPAIDGPHWPLDLYLPNGAGDSIAIADRAAGNLYLIEPSLTKVVAELAIRPAAGKRAVNVAYAAAKNTLYVTDGQSPDLVVIRLETTNLERHYLEVGLAGNLQVSPDGESLYMLVGQGDAAVETLRTADLKSKGRVLLPGRRFGDVDDPTDLMAVSPNGRFLAVMTYTDEPALFTPVLSVVDLTSGQLLWSSPLGKAEKPVGLAFSLQASLPTAPSYPQVLLDRELIGAAELQEALRELGVLSEESTKPPLDADVAMLAGTGPLVLPTLPPEVAALIKPDAAAVKRLAESTTFKWTGRPNMTQQEKETLLGAANDIKPPSDVSEANGYFVLNWLRDFLSE